MTSKRFLALAGSAGMFILPASAFAQSAGVSESIGQTSQSQGARIPRKVTRERRLDVNLGVVATYDTNVARANKSVASASGLTPEDFYFAPVAAVDISLPFGRSDAYLNGSASYLSHVRNTRLDGEQISLAGGVSTSLARCTAGVDGDVGRSRTNIANLQALGAGIRNFETTYSIGASASCGGVVGLQPFGQFYYTQGRNSNPIRAVSDYNTYTYGAGISYIQPSIGEIGIIGSIEDTRYPERGGAGATLGLKSFPTRSIGAYYTRDVTRFFKATVRLNYTAVDTITNNGFKGLTGEASLRIAPSERVNFQLSAFRATRPNLAYNVDYTLGTGVTFDTQVAVTPRLSLNGRYEYTHSRNYISSPLVINPLLNNDTHDVSGEASYKLGVRFALSLGMGYSTRSANSTLYEYNAFRTYLALRSAF